MREHTKILVTGAQGYVGRHLVAHLKSQGFQVVGFVRSLSNQNNDSEVVGTMTDLESLRHATQGIYAVVHLAGAKSDEKDSYATNVVGAQNLVAAATENKVESIVYVSTESVKNPKKGLYARTKEQAEHVFATSGIPTVILRPSLIYGGSGSGAFDSVAKLAGLLLAPSFGDGTRVFHPIHVEDLCAVIAGALDSPLTRGKTYDVGGPSALSFDELLQKIAKDVLQKKHVRILHIPVWFGLLSVRCLSLILRKPPITVSNILGSTQHFPWDTEPLATDIPVHIRTLDEGLAEMRDQRILIEARILYHYLIAHAPAHSSASSKWCTRYLQTLKTHNIPGPMHNLLISFPIFVGPIDAISRLFYPYSPLQRRLLIAAALLETDPASATWLLPQNRSIAGVFFRSALLSIFAITKLCFGLILCIYPGFIKNHAN